MEETDPVVELARESFGIKYLYPYQRLVVANILDAVDAVDSADAAGVCGSDGAERDTVRQVVILPTGAGKSLCFQLPASLCPGPTLVVYPLLGLQADQERRLASTNTRAVVLKGGMTPDARDEAFKAVRSGAARIIIANPEVIAVPGVARFLASASVFHFVIDEAHCVAEWGDGFRPAYLGLGEAVRTIAPKIVTAFTATASPPILERVTEVLFGNRPYRLIAGGPDRPNIRYEVRQALSMRRALRTAVSSMPRPMIVFAASRPGVEILAEDLRGANPCIDTRFYHAGLDAAERAALERWFMSSADGVLCATCAYGMGMDKPDVRTVVHYGPPASVEAYLQESGRAGRDGKPSRAVLLRKAVPSDYGMEDGNGGAPETTPGTDRKAAIARSRAATMRTYATGTYGCRRSFLLGALGAADADELACSGCDVCDGTAARDAPGSAEIRITARRHKRRFEPREMAAFLNGGHGAPAAPYRGALSGWSRDEVEEAIEGARSAGLAAVRARRPWKGRVEPGRATRGAAPPQSGSSSTSSMESASEG